MSLRVVLDTNVWVSAYSAKGACFQLRNELRGAGATLYTSPYILREVQDTLSGKSFEWPAEEWGIAITSIVETAIVIKPKSVPIVLRNKDDNILACAIEAKADWLVTGDKLIQALMHFLDDRDDIEILSPRDALDRLV